MKPSDLEVAKLDSFNFRKAQGLSTAEPLNLESLLLHLNILTVFLPLKKMSGMAIKIDAENQTRRFILVNSNHTLGRQHFTICHELYHLFVQKNFQFKVCDKPMFDKKDMDEYRADLFASYLLIPEDALRSMSLNEDFDVENTLKLRSHILKMEQYFGCSRQSLLYRLSQMGYSELKKDTPLHKDLSKNISLQAQQYGYDLSLYKSANKNKVIGDYGDLAKSLYDKEQISESNFASLMEQIFVNIYTPQTDEPEND